MSLSIERATPRTFQKFPIISDIIYGSPEAQRIEAQRRTDLFLDRIEQFKTALGILAQEGGYIIPTSATIITGLPVSSLFPDEASFHRGNSGLVGKSGDTWRQDFEEKARTLRKTISQSLQDVFRENKRNTWYLIPPNIAKTKNATYTATSYNSSAGSLQVSAKEKGYFPTSLELHSIIETSISAIKDAYGLPKTIDDTLLLPDLWPETLNPYYENEIVEEGKRGKKDRLLRQTIKDIIITSFQLNPSQ